jgi:RNA polymerase sigma factor (sigma-70 family)
MLLGITELQIDEHIWLTRYCARLCGDITQAEDIAQETLITAWQERKHIPDNVERRAWLAGIARNMVRRWTRQRGKDQYHLMQLEADDVPAQSEDLLSYDIERQELAILLDRALALLSNETRTALIAHYIDEQPQKEIAKILGISEGTLAVRLHRGRMHLVRALKKNLGDDLEYYGLSSMKPDLWESTHLWCPMCGHYHLEGQFDKEHTALRLRCRGCGNFLEHGVAVHGAKTYGAAINRVMCWTSEYYLSGTSHGLFYCFSCDRPATWNIEERTWDNITFPNLVIHCPCGATNNCSILFMALVSPMGQTFIHHYRHVRFDQLTYIENDLGRVGVITFANVAGAERFTLHPIVRPSFRSE